MEFPFDLRRLLRPDSSGFAVIQPSRTTSSSREVCDVIDRMGRASSLAQGLKSVITTSSRFLASSDNLLFLLVEGNAVLGILKTAYRKLFHNDQTGRIHEITPLCVLDFYVHESRQRSGFGKVLYERMLAHLQVRPSQLAIDRPSQKFLSFMRKYYGLSHYIPQNNNFVVYNEYFTKPKEDARPALYPRKGLAGSRELDETPSPDYRGGRSREEALSREFPEKPIYHRPSDATTVKPTSSLSRQRPAPTNPVQLTTRPDSSRPTSARPTHIRHDSALQ